MAQSTNDVNPSALKLVCIELTTTLLSTIESCVKAFSDKGTEFSTVQKLGRTHLQDAVPVTLGSEFHSYAATIDRNKQRIKAHLPSLYELNLGGTAVGNAINAPKAYRDAVYTELANLTGYPVVPAQNFMSQTSSQTDFVSLSQAILALTIDASKIANDLRLMSSGPIGGLGEISLEELQAGSSIMPGKVNPILPEAVNQLYYTVSGNNLTIEHASHASFLELANMFPILADRLISTLKLSTDILQKFTDKCVVSIHANTKRCTELLEKSTAYATLLTPVLGYDPVSSVVKESVKSGKSIRELILEKNMMTEDEFNKVTSLL
jgi:aspartate ammonia-lyase